MRNAAPTPWSASIWRSRRSAAPTAAASGSSSTPSASNACSTGWTISGSRSRRRPLSTRSKPRTAPRSRGCGPEGKLEMQGRSSLQNGNTMPKNKSLLILAGDGIGPEVMRQVHRVIDWFAKKRAIAFDVSEGLVGACSLDKHGVPLTDATMEQAMNADAVLLGAVGGPKWDSLPFEKKPERGLLRLRKDRAL